MWIVPVRDRSAVVGDQRWFGELRDELPEEVFPEVAFGSQLCYLVVLGAAISRSSRTPEQPVRQ